jgi:hypothetical protein
MQSSLNLLLVVVVFSKRLCLDRHSAERPSHWPFNRSKNLLAAALTRLKFRSYTRCVLQCRIIAAAFLGVWLVLLAGDFCDDLGLFDDDDAAAVDQALDGALAALGQAIDTSDHSDMAPWFVAHDSSGAAMPAMLPTPFFIIHETFRDARLRIVPAREPVNDFRERSTVLLL